MNVGMIGGADGPTAIFVSGGLPPEAVLHAMGLLVVSVIVIILIRKLYNRHRDK